MGILEAIGAIIAAVVAAFFLGRRQGSKTKDAEHGKEYIQERKRQDGLDVGHGASDAERIKRLHEIVNRNGKRKN